MKRIFSLAIILTFSYSLLSQIPQGFNYQAVYRDVSGNPITDQNVAIIISILQGTVDGTQIFTETHTGTTNEFGLITLIIGSINTSDFPNIDWTTGPYFLKVNINGNPMGVTQLLSVPFAMHTKTAETITGTITEADPIFTNWDKRTGISITESQITDLGEYLKNETDPIFSASEAFNITSLDIWKLMLLSGLNTGDQDISGISANTQAIQDTATQIRADIPSVKIYSVGDFAQGGVVFWLDETGQHGLVCTTTDLGARKSWCENSGFYGAFGDGPYAGEMNTNLIIAHDMAIYFEQANFAAIVCANLQITEGNKTYGDWYLPSKEELNLVYQNKSIIDATALANGKSAISPDYYWSSTEHSIAPEVAWRQRFSDGLQIEGFKGSDRSYVIAIRAF